MKTQIPVWVAVGAVGTVLGVALLTAGCHTTGESEKPSSVGAAQLWSQNCNRCHNYRSPGSLSDAEWDVAMHHMRLRANLTAEEHEAILDFLKSGN
jgi:hypothetical protein